MKKEQIKNQRGFTLVEMMIAIGLFSVLMTIGIGAILGVNSTHRKTQTMRAVIDNLSFLMEDMARSMRLGDSFYCKESGAPDFTELSGSPQASKNGGMGSDLCDSISFEPFWDRQPSNVGNQIIYYITDIDNVGTIVKKDELPSSTFNVSDWKPVTPVEIDIDLDRSGFAVTGAEDDSDLEQPLIRIVLVGTVRMAGVSTEFNLQTTVSQRILDVNIVP